MFTLKCKDMDPSSTCDFMATGVTRDEAMENMKVHAKEAHADKVGGMTDEQIAGMMSPHVKEEAAAM